MVAEAMLNMQSASSDLYGAFLALRKERGLRHRDAALALGVTEGAAIAEAVGRRGDLRAVRLEGPWPELFEQVPSIGTVMALTRNDTTVHEKIGRYEKMSHEGSMGMALGSDIDLRIFYMHWAHAYAVTEDTPKGETRSLQIYDKHGYAIHKVHLRAESELQPWLEFVERNLARRQEAGEAFPCARVTLEVTSDEDVDVDAFRSAWAAMKDTHEFFPLLRRFKLERNRALRLASPDFAYRVGTASVRQLLDDAARSGTSIMCFVGNRGMIQIHTGPITRIESRGEWLNVLDARFNLHVREDRIADVWVVRKPTVDGDVTSVELFDGEESTMAMFFGERKPGMRESADWRALVGRLARLAR